MRQYEDQAWKDSMRIRLDVNHLMDEYMDASAQPGFEKQVGAITEADLAKIMPKAERARRSLAHKWGKLPR